MENTVPLTIKGARGNVAIQTVALVFFKILLNGEVLKQRRGRWMIPTRDGRTKELRVRGFVPGFQKLFADGEQVHDMGGDVSRLERIVMFVPLLLIAVNPWLGLPVGLIMFFMNVTLVKNPTLPRPLRIALPVINTVAAAVVFLALDGRLG